jgi:LysR family glycine cleavage system transcriptional activator
MTHDAAPYELPPLTWLRAFEASARHSSFTAAAAELNLTQAAVSHQVRSLERHLGVRLFKRLPRKLLLTEIGIAYLPPLRRSFDDIAATTAGLFGPIGRHTLVVRVPMTFAALVLAPRLGGFTEAYPEIAIRILSVVWSHMVEDDAPDVDIRFGDGHWPGFHAEPIGVCPSVAVIRPDLVPPGTPAERLAAVAARPLIHVTGYEDLWQRLLRPHGIHTAAFDGLNVDTSVTALELAANGYGPAIVLESFAEPYLSSGRLVRLVEQTIPVAQAHYILLPDNAARAHPETTLFLNWLRAALAPPPAAEISVAGAGP